MKFDNFALKDIFTKINDCFEISQDPNGSSWEMDDILIFDLCAKSEKRVKLVLIFYKDDEKVFQITQNFLPNYRVKVPFPLSLLKGQNWFTVTYPGSFKGTTSGLPVLIEDINKIEINVKSAKAQDVEIYNVYLCKELPDLSVKGPALMDEFGQMKKFDWQGKTKSIKELSAALKKEYNEYLNATEENDFKDCFGGWTKKRFEPKGHFYITNDGNRPWIVDPLGNAFFSLGIGYGSGSRVGCFGYVDGMEDLYTDLPPENDALFSKSWSEPNDNPEYVKRNGLLVGKNRKMFNHLRYNLMRVFKQNWLDAWCVLLKGRFKKWGFNTICIGVDVTQDEDALIYAQKLEIPYIYRMQLFPQTTVTIFRDFCDVYSPEYQEKSAIFAEQLKRFVNDPYFMGYYMFNEPEWMAADHNINMAKVVLNSNQVSATKSYVINKIKDKYVTINSVNSAWDTNYKSFEDIFIEDFLNETMQFDLEVLSEKLIDQYWRIPAKECEKVTENKAINFGFRSAGPWAASFGKGSNCLDVYSFNCYSKTPANDLMMAKQITDKPLIISEWHIGQASNQLFTPGLKGAKGQKERGITCSDYFNAAFADKSCVGVHYFEYVDMSVLGRYDGANAQIGFVDCCYRVYEETMDIIAKGNEKMYEIANGDHNTKLLGEDIEMFFW